MKTIEIRQEFEWGFNGVITPNNKTNLDSILNELNLNKDELNCIFGEKSLKDCIQFGYKCRFEVSNTRNGLNLTFYENTNAKEAAYGFWYENLSKEDREKEDEFRDKTRKEQEAWHKNHLSRNRAWINKPI